MAASLASKSSKVKPSGGVTTVADLFMEHCNRIMSPTLRAGNTTLAVPDVVLGFVAATLTNDIAIKQNATQELTVKFNSCVAVRFLLPQLRDLLFNYNMLILKGKSPSSKPNHNPAMTKP